MVLILESRSHLDLGDLPNMLAAELGVMTVRLERAIRSLDDVARVHVNRWGDGEAHLHLWFMGRPRGRLQLRGTFLSLWDEILPPVPEAKWRENLALVAAWLAEFGGTPLAEPPRIDWKAPAKLETAVPLVLDAEEGRTPEENGVADESDRTADDAIAGDRITGDRVADDAIDDDRTAMKDGTASDPYGPGPVESSQARGAADDGDSVPVTMPPVVPAPSSTQAGEAESEAIGGSPDGEPSTSGVRHPVPGASRS
jgi:hypothetical protein